MVTCGSEERVVLHRMRLGPTDGSYAGDLVSGAKAMAIFADIETEISLLEGGDEGLCVGYDSVEFLQPLMVGDFVEATGCVASKGRSSRKIKLELRKMLSVDSKGRVVTYNGGSVLAVRASATIVVGKRFAEHAGLK